MVHHISQTEIIIRKLNYIISHVCALVIVSTILVYIRAIEVVAYK